MNFRGGVISGILFTLLALGAGAGIWWLVAGKPFEPKKSATPPVPAEVPKTAKEDQFNVVKLKPVAVDSLAVRVGKVVRKPMPRTRFYGAEVTIPPGKTIVVAAPFSGVLQLAGTSAPAAGAQVTKGTPIFELLPLLTGEGRATIGAARVDAHVQVKNAETTFGLADIALKRAKKLLMGDAGSQRMVDEAEAAFNLAQKTLDAARERYNTLVRIAGEADKGTAAPIAVEAPADGLIRNLSATAGQNVPAGGIIFEVLDLRTVWVRVPIFVGDARDIAGLSAACVVDLGARPDERSRVAVRIAAPPSANPIAGTVDLYFELDNAAGKYRPGERVGVTVLLKDEDEGDSLVVPWKAVLYDINGGAWVYEAIGDWTYVRRRVVVRRVVGDEAVLDDGPSVGKEVVTDGAAEIFGTETGYSK